MGPQVGGEGAVMIYNVNVYTSVNFQSLVFWPGAWEVRWVVGGIMDNWLRVKGDKNHMEVCYVYFKSVWLHSCLLIMHARMCVCNRA